MPQAQQKITTPAPATARQAVFSEYPRVKLTTLPSPLEKLERLSAYLGKVNIYVKRDDLTSLGGGNKVRKLEYLLGAALAEGADTVITQGAVQSNHVRTTVAAATKLGLESHAFLERRVSDTAPSYETTGNVLLDHLFGITSLQFVAAGTDMNKAMEAKAAELRSEGKKPYIIPGGGSNNIGGIGYVHAAAELLDQASNINLQIDHVIAASGSGGTHAGLAVGFANFSPSTKVTGISVRQPPTVQTPLITGKVVQIAEFLGLTPPPTNAINVNGDYFGAGYGIPTELTWEAIALAARLEGLILDPVYSGKAFAGLIGLTRQGAFKQGENIVFFHTGGAYGLFAYENELKNYLKTFRL